MNDRSHLIENLKKIEEGSSFFLSVYNTFGESVYFRLHVFNFSSQEEVFNQINFKDEVLDGNRLQIATISFKSRNLWFYDV